MTANVPDPAGGYHWGTPKDTGVRGRPSGGRGGMRWLLIALAVLLVVPAGAGFAWWQFSRHTGANKAAAGSAEDLPTGQLMPFSLAHPPVTTWTTSVTDLGLPPAVQAGWPIFAEGDRGYFATGCGSHDCESFRTWIYGLNLKTGESLFPPIELNPFGGECFPNGPGVAVCISDDDEKFGLTHRAWVLDLINGRITYDGPTEIYTGKDDGISPWALYEKTNKYGASYMLARVLDKGIYGVGPHAELTWFIPGSGQPPATSVPTVPPTTLKVQNPVSDSPQRRPTFFSTVDGSVIDIQPPTGAEFIHCNSYPETFACDYHGDGGADGVAFYDAHGKELARDTAKNSHLILLSSLQIPIAYQTPGTAWKVYSLEGRPINGLLAFTETTDFAVLGSKLLALKESKKVQSDSRHAGGYSHWWTIADLITGESFPLCDFNLNSEFSGSDGTFVIIQQRSEAARAINLTTCETAWETEGSVDYGWVEAFIPLGPYLLRTAQDLHAYSGQGEGA